MTTADPGQAAPRWGARAGDDLDDARAPTAADPHDTRAALAAARIDAPGGRDDLVALLDVAAEAYAARVLGLHGPAAVPDLVDAAVVRAVRTLPRDLGPDELLDHLHLAVREEAWRRQRGRGAHPAATRALVAAALVLVAVALGAVVMTVAGSLDDGTSSSPIAVHTEGTGVIEGRVVDTSAAGTVLGGRAGLEVALLDDGTVVTTTVTDDAGGFALTGLAPGTYEVRLAVPVGLQLRGARDGRTTTVDLTGRTEARLVLQLQRS